MNRFFFFFASLFLFSLLGCTSTNEGFISKDPKKAGDSSVHIRKADLAMKEMYKRDQLELAIVEYEKAYQIENDGYVLTQLSKAYFYKTACFIDPEEKETIIEYYGKGREYGIEALKTNPKIREAFEQKKEWDEIVKLTEKEDVPLLFWLVSNWAKLAEARGLTQSAVDIPKGFIIAQRILALNEDFLAGGIHRFLGAYYAKVPQVSGGDLEKSKEHFEKAANKYPDYLLNKAMYAFYYCASADEEELYEELLTEIEETPPVDIYMEWKLDNDFARKEAKRLLSEDVMDELF